MKKVARGIAVGALGVMLAACSSGGGSGGPASLAQGQSDITAGNYSSAKAVLEKYVKASPSDKFGWYNLGLAEYNLNNVSAADKDYLQAIKLDANFEFALYNYGFDRYQEKDNGTAVVYLRRAIKVSPTDASAHLFLGRALALEAGTDKTLAAQATRELNTALTLNPAFRQNLCQTLGLQTTNGKCPAPVGGSGASASTSTTAVTPGKTAPTTTTAK